MWKHEKTIDYTSLKSYHPPLSPFVPRMREGEKAPSLISRYPYEASAQETNWISLPRHANDRIPFPWLEVVGAMHLLARSSGGRSRRHSSENRIIVAVERIPFPARMLSKYQKKRRRKKIEKKQPRTIYTEKYKWIRRISSCFRNLAISRIYRLCINVWYDKS